MTRLPLSVFLLILVLVSPAPAGAQSLGDLVKRRAPADSTAAARDTSRVDAAPWPIVVGEVVLGSSLAAALGYGVGALAEAVFCETCDASEPGGDTPGLVVGVPLGAVAGVWLIGRRAPPEGRLQETALAALAGAAVFAGFSELLENQGDGFRWSGVLLTGAVTAIGWNRSRMLAPAEVAMSGGFGRFGGPFGASGARAYGIPREPVEIRVLKVAF